MSLRLLTYDYDTNRLQVSEITKPDDCSTSQPSQVTDAKPRATELLVKLDSTGPQGASTSSLKRKREEGVSTEKQLPKDALVTKTEPQSDKVAMKVQMVPYQPALVKETPTKIQNSTSSTIQAPIVPSNTLGPPQTVYGAKGERYHFMLRVPRIQNDTIWALPRSGTGIVNLEKIHQSTGSGKFDTDTGVKQYLVVGILPHARGSARKLPETEVHLLESGDKSGVVVCPVPTGANFHFRLYSLETSWRPNVLARGNSVQDIDVCFFDEFTRDARTANDLVVWRKRLRQAIGKAVKDVRDQAKKSK